MEHCVLTLALWCKCCPSSPAPPWAATGAVSWVACWTLPPPPAVHVRSPAPRQQCWPARRPGVGRSAQRWGWRQISQGEKEHELEEEDARKRRRICKLAKCRIRLAQRGQYVTSDPLLDLRSSKIVQMKGIGAPRKKSWEHFFVYVSGRYLKKKSHLLD